MLLSFFYFMFRENVLNCFLVCFWTSFNWLCLDKPCQLRLLLSPTSASDLTAVFGFACCVSGATSCAGNSSSAFLLVAQSMASLGRPLASPLLWSISTFSHEIYHRGFVSRVRFNLTVVHVLFTLLPPSDRPFSTVGNTSRSLPTLPAPVRGLRGLGGGWGQQGRPPLRGFSPHFFPARFPWREKGFPRTGGKQILGCSSFFWGDFRWTSTYGGRGSIILRPSLRWVFRFYPSDPYRPHTLEHVASFGFRTGLCLFGSFRVSGRTIFPVTFDNFRRVVPRVVDKEARSLLFKYMGDLYRVATNIFGGAVAKFLTGQALRAGRGWSFGSVYRALYWCTPSPFRHKPPVGIRYRIFANWSRRTTF